MSDPTSVPSGDPDPSGVHPLYPVLVGGLMHDLNNGLAVLSATVEVAQFNEAMALRMLQEGRFRARLEHLGRISTLIQALSRAYYARTRETSRPEAELEKTLATHALTDPSIRMETAWEVPPDRMNLPLGFVTFVVGEMLKNASRALVGVSEPWVRLSSAASSDGGTLTIECQDNGPGFSEEMVSAIRNGSLRPPNAFGQGGYGLYLMNEMVARLGGKMLASNREGSGGSIALLIPFAKDPTA